MKKKVRRGEKSQVITMEMFLTLWLKTLLLEEEGRGIVGRGRGRREIASVNMH